MNIFKAKTKRQTLGDIGEKAACRYLKLRGYKILKRNFIAADGEIDIVAESRSAIVFVEVKTRTKETQNEMESRPSAAVTPHKQRHILRTSKFFPKPNGKPMRFDIIEVIYAKENLKKPEQITHMVSAFNRDTAYSKK